MRHDISHFIVVIFLIAVAIPRIVLSAGLPEAEVSATDRSLFEGLIIDSIVIDNRNIYDVDSEEYRAFVFKLANKLHYRTRQNVVAREVLFQPGDVYSVALAEESSRNIRKNLAVYDAWLREEILPNGRLLITVVTIDRWSLNGGLDFVREGNETNYRIGIEESNLLGSNQFLSLYYFNKASEPNFVEARFSENRLGGKEYRLEVIFNGNPLQESKIIALSKPYYSLAQNYSFGISYGKSSGRRDTYDDTLRIAESFYDGETTAAEATYRFGSYSTKLELGINYMYHYEKSRDRSILSPDVHDSLLAVTSFPPDSSYHELGVQAGFSNLRFAEAHKIDGFGFTEDFTLGSFLMCGFARAFEPGFDNHQFDVVRFGVSQYGGSGSGLFFFDYSHEFWYRGEDNIRHVAMLSGKYYRRINGLLTVAARGIYISDWDDEERNPLVLGGTNGVRGYDKFYMTGNRKAVFNLEGRLYSGLEILSAQLGGAVFVDNGNIWKDGEALKFRDFLTSVGLGLRIAFEKSTRNIVRIDLAYSDSNGWELSIGTNQYFFAQRSS